MNTESKYQLEMIEGRQNIGLIHLKSKVLGGSDALEFTSALQAAKDNKLKAVIADLSSVDLINSTGLGMLVGAMSNLRNSNTTFVLANVPDKVAGLLEVTHLNKVFKCYASLDSALEAL